MHYDLSSKHWHADFKYSVKFSLSYHHECLDFCGTVEPSVPLQRVNERCVRSSPGLLPMRWFPQDHLAGRELWVSHTLASHSHLSLPDGARESWKITIQVCVPHMVFPRNIEGCS